MNCIDCKYYRPNVLGFGMLCDKKREFILDDPKKMSCNEFEFKPLEEESGVDGNLEGY